MWAIGNGLFLLWANFFVEQRKNSHAEVVVYNQNGLLILPHWVSSYIIWLEIYWKFEGIDKLKVDIFTGGLDATLSGRFLPLTKALECYGVECKVIVPIDWNYIANKYYKLLMHNLVNNKVSTIKKLNI